MEEGEIYAGLTLSLIQPFVEVSRGQCATEQLLQCPTSESDLAGIYGSAMDVRLPSGMSKDRYLVRVRFRTSSTARLFSFAMYLFPYRELPCQHCNRSPYWIDVAMEWHSCVSWVGTLHHCSWSGACPFFVPIFEIHLFFDDIGAIRGSIESPQRWHE